MEKINVKMEKKANIGIQTIFYIMMGVIFVGIILFGFSSILGVQDQISEQERVELTNAVKRTLIECDEPLNKGTVKIHEITHADINGFCIASGGSASSMVLNDGGSFASYDELQVALDSGDNLIFFDGKSVDNGDGYEIVEYNIQGTANVDLSRSNMDVCFFDDENKGKVVARITCQ